MQLVAHLLQKPNLQSSQVKLLKIKIIKKGKVKFHHSNMQLTSAISSQYSQCVAAFLCLSLFPPPLFEIPFLSFLWLSTRPSHSPLLLLPFSNTLFNFSTLFNSPSSEPLAFHHSLQCSFAKKSRGSQGDVVSLCKCHFVSSEGGGRKQRGKVRGKEFMLRDATPSFALLGSNGGASTVRGRVEETEGADGIRLTGWLIQNSVCLLPKR